MQINIHTLSQDSQVSEHNDGINAVIKQTAHKPFIPSTDLDQQSIYSTSSSASSLTLSSPSPSLTVSPNYNISNLDWSLTNNFSISSQYNQLTDTINTAANNIFTQLKINTKILCKKSIYISREMIEFINQFCIETFDTYQKNDMGLLFSYIKESNAMQINDKQINIHQTFNGKVIIINIDLHFKNNKIMYLIGMLNDLKYIQKIPWKIITIMNDETIYKSFGITKNKLPKSSRNMRYFIDGLAMSPEYIYVPESVIWKTNFKKLSEKTSKKIDENDITVVNISEYDLKYYCVKSWNNGMCLPVVFIKGERHFIEWKKFVRIFNDQNGNQQWIGISLRYYKLNKEWKIGCMDYDCGRLFYQFKLVGNNHNYNYCYNDLSGLVNTKLNIF